MLTVIRDGNGKINFGDFSLPFISLGNAKDTFTTFKLHDILKSKLEKDTFSRFYRYIYREVVPIFADIEQEGLDVDTDKLSKMKVEMGREIEAVQADIIKNIGKDVNLKSPKQLAELLYDDLKFEVLKETKTSRSTDAETLKELLKRQPDGPGKDFLTLFLGYRKLEKLYSTYVCGIEKALEITKNNKIYVSYNLDGTKTSRTSNSAYKLGGKDKLGVSFHTLPREQGKYNIRDLIIVKEDEVLLAADYSAVELRVLAHVSRDLELCRAFQEGIDPHSNSARLVLMKDKLTDEERQSGKTSNFLVVYGGGPNKLASSCNMSFFAAKKFLKRHRQVHSGIYSWKKDVEEFIEATNNAISLFGIRRRLPDVKHKDKKVRMSCLRQGVNHIIQNSASSIMLTGIADLNRELISKGFAGKFRFMGTVHDSLEIAIKKEYLEDLYPIVKETLVCPPSLKSVFNLELIVPLKVDIEIGTSFGNVEKV